MKRPWNSQVSATVLTLMVLAGTATAQLGGLSPAERVLWLGLGTRRVSTGEFMGTMYALQAMDRANIARQQQYAQQQIAAQRARMDQARLRGIMSRPPVGEAPFPATSAATETPMERQEVSDFLLCWEVLGCTFDGVEIDAVRAVDPKLDAGLRVAAIKIGSPVDKAGWQAGDILVGLYKYRIRSYDNAAYVADLPDLVAQSPVRAMLIRSSKVIELPLDFGNLEGAPGAGAGPAKAAPVAPKQNPPPSNEKPMSDRTESPPKPVSAIEVHAGEEGVKTASTSQPSKIAELQSKSTEMVWQALGVRGEPAAIDKLGTKYDRGLRIVEVRQTSPAAKAGWANGDVLVGLGGFQVRSVEDASYVVGETKGRGPTEYIVLSGSSIKRGKMELPPEPSAVPKSPGH